MLASLRLVGVLLAAGPPEATPPRAPDLVWQAPAGCPDEAALRAQIDALLAGAPAGALRALTVDLRVERLSGDRWRLHAELRGPGIVGRRDLEAGRCLELTEAAALLTAIAIYPALESGPADSAPPATALVPEAPPVAASSAATPAPLPDAPSDISHVPPDISESTPEAPTPPAPRPALRWPLGLGAGPGLGVLPGVSAVLRASAGVRGRGWGVALTQTFWLPRDLPAPADPAVGGRLWLWAAGLRGCAIPAVGRVEFPLCAGIEAGVLTGRGTGDLEVTRRATSAWAAASVGPGLAVRLASRLAFTLGVDMLVVLAYPRLQVAGRGTVCCDAPVGATAIVGLALQRF